MKTITRNKYSLCRATYNLLCKDYCFHNFYGKKGKCVASRKSKYAEMISLLGVSIVDES